MHRNIKTLLVLLLSYCLAVTPVNSQFLITEGGTGGSGSGTVTDVSVINANGFNGSVANSTTTPAITLTTTISGNICGNGTALSACSTTGTASTVLAISPSLTTPILISPSITGSLSISTLRIGSGSLLTTSNQTGTGDIVLSASPTITGTASIAAISTNTITIGGGSAITSSGVGGALGTAAFQNTGTSGATLPFLNGANTWSGSQTISGASVPLIIASSGAASFSPLSISGSVFTGGSGTTTFPLVYINSGAAPTTFATTGTLLGFNAPSGYAGVFIDFMTNGAASLHQINSAGAMFNRGFAVTSSSAVSYASGAIGWASTASVTTSSSPDALFTRAGIASIRLGGAPAASPVSYTFSGQSSRSGTDSNVAGATITYQAGNGTGNITPSSLIFQSPVAIASGVTAQTMTTGLIVNQGTFASNGHTVATLPTTPVIGARAHVTDQLTACPATGAALTGGGAVVCPAFWNGAAWVGG